LIRCVIGHYRSQWLNPRRSLRRTDYALSYDERVGRYFAAGALLSNNLVLILVLVNDNTDAARVSFVSKPEVSFVDLCPNVGFDTIQALRYRICHFSVACSSFVNRASNSTDCSTRA